MGLLIFSQKEPTCSYFLMGGRGESLGLDGNVVLPSKQVIFFARKQNLTGKNETKSLLDNDNKEKNRDQAEHQISPFILRQLDKNIKEKRMSPRVKHLCVFPTQLQEPV